MITHILDTSALLAHNQNERGADQVTALLAFGPEQIGISALTLVELKTRLHEIHGEEAEVERLFSLYRMLTSTIAVTDDIALQALLIREQTRERVPLVDSIIAGTAKLMNAILVHRDPHLAGIPEAVVRQIRLPQKV